MAHCDRNGTIYNRHRYVTPRGSADASLKVCEACQKPKAHVDQAAAAERRLWRRRRARFHRRWHALANRFMPLDRMSEAYKLAMPAEQFVHISACRPNE